MLKVLDYICTAFFSVELVVRIAFSPDKKEFFTSPMNIIDILALLPLYVQDFLEFTDGYSCLGTNRAVLETIFILRIIRIFRIFHILKHYKALKILVHAIKASMHELLMLAIFLFIGMLMFSTMIFYVEGPGHLSSHKEAKFKTIPVGFWWSIITMTTVGYGDVFPDTPLGCVIGMLCAISGVILVALTIPVISNNFALFYLHARTREQITNRGDSERDSDVVMPTHLNRNSRRSSCITLERLDRDGVNGKNHWDFRSLLPPIESNSTLENDIMMNSVVQESEAKDGPIIMIDDDQVSANAKSKPDHFDNHSFHSDINEKINI